MSGVSCVLLLSPLDGKTSGSQLLENLMRKVELLGKQSVIELQTIPLIPVGAVRTGRMHVESAFYMSGSAKAHCKNFQIMTSTEFPASCFVLTDNGTMLVADLAFREFAGYLKASYQRKKKLQVEGKGIKYKIGDFAINFVTLFMGQSAAVKGYLVEVVFQPSCMIHLCGDVLRAFITQVLSDVCPPANDSSAAENLFSQSFHRALQSGSVDIARWPSSVPIAAAPGFVHQPEDQPLVHACVRLTMTQYAEHINTVRRLSRQTVSSASNSMSVSSTSYAKSSVAHIQPSVTPTDSPMSQTAP
ncbi:Mediator of RNA polymerase II transcription subunit 20 [Fasciola gigantica]|uniref:Mediator of RNA polymerase II transcription subunit 20 n=1 Tax=Fasciola gigantica TaxID=46835 RepID=A0A504Y4Q1_FASGI|nr:Mediator of RNA polymerase II transcription subunit 20 [Fasciola gigantica]